MLRLKNPHSILATLIKRPTAVKAIEVQSGQQAGTWEAVIERAAHHGIAVTSHLTTQLQRRRGQHTERIGGNAAQIEPPSPIPLSGMLPRNDQSGGLWLALDQVQDPQNLGAIFRLAGFFGVRGMVITRDKSAPITETVCDVSAGGVEHVPFSQVPNLAQAFKTVQQSGIWIVGTCERSSINIRDLPRDRNWMLAVGNEGVGLRRLTREKCDELCALPANGPVPSLNVATAAAACLSIMSAPA